jgi:hypothetical protein
MCVTGCMRATTHLGHLVAAKSDDATLDALRYLLYGEHWIFVSRATLGRMITLLRHYCSKNINPCRQAKRTERVPILRCEYGKTIKRVKV